MASALPSWWPHLGDLAFQSFGTKVVVLSHLQLSRNIGKGKVWYSGPRQDLKLTDSDRRPEEILSELSGPLNMGSAQYFLKKSLKRLGNHYYEENAGGRPRRGTSLEATKEHGEGLVLESVPGAQTPHARSCRVLICSSTWPDCFT